MLEGKCGGRQVILSSNSNLKINEFMQKIILRGSGLVWLVWFFVNSCLLLPNLRTEHESVREGRRVLSFLSTFCINSLA